MILPTCIHHVLLCAKWACTCTHEILQIIGTRIILLSSCIIIIIILHVHVLYIFQYMYMYVAMCINAVCVFHSTATEIEDGPVGTPPEFPMITRQPKSVRVEYGGPVTLSCQARGSGIIYDW